MKTMKCSQLGGPENCDKEFHAETFEEMAKQSKEHGTEMFEKQDLKHLEAMGEMQELMGNPNLMQKWMDAKKQEFENLDEN